MAGTRFLAVIAALALVVAALAGFGWGVVKTVDAVVLIINSQGHANGIIIALVEIVDAFLVSMALLIFSLGTCELFITELPLPEGMHIGNLHDRKAKLGGVLIMVMAVKFLEKLALWENARDTLFFSLAIAVIAAVLIVFGAFGGKD